MSQEKSELWRVLAKTGHNALRTVSQHGERVDGGLDGDLYESALSQGQRALKWRTGNTASRSTPL